ncbi:unnamed protein product [Malus baccata var. baccata]
MEIRSMEWYYKQKSSSISSDNHIPNSSSSNLDSSNPILNSSPQIPNSSDPIVGNSTPQQHELKVNLDNLERDPGKRIPMKDYHPNIRDEVQKAYILMEPFIAKDHGFPFTLHLNEKRRYIETVVVKQSKARMAYRTCLNASIDCTKFLLRQGLSFRGHDENDTSNNRDHDEKIKVVMLDKALGNLNLIALSIKKDLFHSCSIETIKTIISDMKNARFFSLLVDEAHDVSINDQMAKVIERFVGVQHVPDTTSNTLKTSIDAFFNFNGNMKGEFNGPKTKILNEQPYAFYVHCFAHQLKLALVAVAKDNVVVNTFFLLANNVVTNIRASCKCRDTLREMQQNELMKALGNDSLVMGRGLNQ